MWFERVNSITESCFLMFYSLEWHLEMHRKMSLSNLILESSK